MGEEAGRKSALRRVTALLLAVILALSLGPAILLRLYPLEMQRYLLNPLGDIVESRTGFSAQPITAISLVAMFVVAIIAASALLLLLSREFFKSMRQS
jgi:hypothetical protein